MKDPRRSTNIALGVIGLGLLLVGLAGLVALLSLRAGQALQGLELGPAPMRVNYPAPELQLNDLRGVSHSLEEYRGQVVLVNLWATWCPPCVEEMPVLQKYYARHWQDGFVVIAIEDGEPVAEVAAFVSQYRLAFPVWTDPTYLTSRHFRTDVLPSSWVIDREGKVRLAWTGAITLDKLEQYVTPLIEE